jgi:signal transduction histidine kinase
MLLLQIDKAKIKLSLERQSYKIILSMQHYNNVDKVYHFPRYKEYKSALYDINYNIIFSTIDFTPDHLSEGFHQISDNYYLVYPLPKGYYFNASYLLVSTQHTANSIYFMATGVMFLIIIVLFIFSLLLLKNFSAPFENLNRQLDNFIKDSMHEINTPLTIINLNVDLFANKYGENRYLWRIKSASKTLATIYNDMDYLVKEGRVEDKKSNINFSEFITNRVNYFQEIANLKDIRLNMNIEEDIYYLFSKRKLQRVVDNTLSNAIKYSLDNKDVDINLNREDDKIIFIVRDNGVGIEDTAKIFSRYYREDETKGGFGIGLNIVKSIIEEEKIKLEVTSQMNSGTLFRYIFRADI